MTYQNFDSYQRTADLAALTTEELAAKIREQGEWDGELLYELCWRAGIDPYGEWNIAAYEGGEDEAIYEKELYEVAEEAAEQLGVTIY